MVKHSFKTAFWSFPFIGNLLKTLCMYKAQIWHGQNILRRHSTVTRKVRFWSSSQQHGWLETSKSYKFIKFTQSPVIGIPFEFALSLQLVTNILKKNLLPLNQVLINNFGIFLFLFFWTKTYSWESCLCHQTLCLIIFWGFYWLECYMSTISAKFRQSTLSRF